MTGAQALTKSLIDYGIDTIFTLPGAQLDPMFDALYDEKERIKVIHTRHEQGTSYMALSQGPLAGHRNPLLKAEQVDLLHAGLPN